MTGKKLIWQLFFSCLGVTLVALIAVTWYCSYSLRSFYLEQTRQRLTTLAHVTAQQVSVALSNTDSASLD
jgi:type VI protein secretion system component VasK